LLPDDTTVDDVGEQTILQASLAAGVAHTHVCGGNARCSTCRVIVMEGVEGCLARTSDEQVIADELGFTPEFRLACQTRLRGDVTARRLVLDPEDIVLTDLTEGGNPAPVGHEQDVAVLFSDIRSFTTLSESLLPYDVIHLLNRHFHEMNTAIERHRGVVTAYMGDGLMALFGLDDPLSGPLDAVRAGLDMLAAVDEHRPYTEELYGTCYELGVGVHSGPVVVGSLGGGRVTAIGDNVNLASRIESANKETGTRFLVSETTWQAVARHATAGLRADLALKGKSGTHQLVEITGLRPVG
jgi:adenylate cyclase